MSGKVSTRQANRGDGVHDDGRPRRQAHNRTDSKRGYTKNPRQRLLSDAEVRFVYEGELKGEWFSAARAMAEGLPILPNEEYRVIRLEIRDVSDL